MATRIYIGSGCCCQRSNEIAEPVDFESDIDRSEGSRGSTERIAAMRSRYACGVHPTAGPHRCGPAVYPGDEVHTARGCVLRVPECVGIFRPWRIELRRGCRPRFAA